MTRTVQLATARELAAAGSVRDTVLVGQPGGYSVLFKVGVAERALATKTGVTRVFSGLDAAARVLRNELGIHHYQVDASGYDAATERRRRPDRSAAFKQAHEDAAFAEFLREGTQTAVDDPRPALSSTEAARHMQQVRNRLQARLDAALASKEGKPA